MRTPATKEILEWLKQLGMSEYAERFAEKGIGVAALRYLTDQDLKDVGVLLGHRRIILAAIGELASAASATPKAEANVTAASAPTSATPSITVASAAPVTEAVGERRHVTVMFCDLVDSRRLDAEEWRDLVPFVTASTLHGASPSTLLGSAQRNFFNTLDTGVLMARIRRAIKQLGEKQMYKFALAVAAVLLSSPTWAQTVDLKWNYVGTLEIDLEGGQMVGTRMVFWDKAATFKGPKINATQQQPSGDWVVPQADGSLKLDIRATFKTDDGELLLWEANGVARFLSKEAADRFGKGEQLTSKDAYLFETPRISVASAESKYQWLTQAQLVGKMTTLKPTHVGFDIFSVE